MQVADRCPTQVVQVLALTVVAGATTCQRPTWARGLDRDSFAQSRPPLGRLLPSAELCQQPLIGVDLHAAALTTGSALLPQRAVAADLGRELDLASGR